MAAAGGKPHVLLLRPVDAPFAAALRDRFRVLDFHASGQTMPAFLAAAAAVPDPPRATVVWAGGGVRVDASFLDAAPSLRCVVSTAAGLDHIDLAECARRGVAVANSGEVYSADVADHAVGLLLDVLRSVSASQRYVRRGSWAVQGDYPLGSKLGGKRVGIIGLGNIGSRIAKRLEAFGCAIQYNSRKPKDSVSYKYFPNVQDLAAESDVLVVACALNKATRHIVNKDVLEALGKGGVVINIGRGANIDEAELVIALREGKIAGAGLDVFEHEPKVPAELFSMDNVVLSPHVAVWTEESRSDLCLHTIGNLEAFFSDCSSFRPINHKGTTMDDPRPILSNQSMVLLFQSCTALSNGFPEKQASSLAATSSMEPRMDSGVAMALWPDNTTLSTEKSSGGTAGSFSNMSRPAPPMTPSCRHLTSSGSSTRPHALL